MAYTELDLREKRAMEDMLNAKMPVLMDADFRGSVTSELKWSRR